MVKAGVPKARDAAFERVLADVAVLLQDGDVIAVARRDARRTPDPPSPTAR
jgi:hypothetical protein